MPDDVTGPPSHADRARAAEPGITRWLVGRARRRPRPSCATSPTSRHPSTSRAAGTGTASTGRSRPWSAGLAELLGKPAVAMFPSGVMAQQSMLRVWCDARGSRRVAMPALSHLLRSEADGPRLLHGLEPALLTDGARVPGVADLAAIPGPLGAALLELPLREAGFLLPSWDELVAFSEACRSRGVPLHLDGARLWESAPHLGHTPAEVAALADSVYVSFYKGLGGLSGAAVAGPEEQVAQVRLWRTRMGGTLFSLLPYAVAALRGLDRELPRMAEYHERAVALAERMAAHGIRVSPSPPHTNAFRIHVERDADDVNERRVAAMEAEHLALTPPWRAADVPGWSWTEFGVGPATTEWDVDEVVEVLVRVFVD